MAWHLRSTRDGGSDGAVVIDDKVFAPRVPSHGAQKELPDGLVARDAFAGMIGEDVINEMKLSACVPRFLSLQVASMMVENRSDNICPRPGSQTILEGVWDRKATRRLW